MTDQPHVNTSAAAYQNALVLLSVEKTKSNANCLHEEDFNIALDLNACIDRAGNSEPYFVELIVASKK
jgi:hypothetical protein